MKKAVFDETGLKEYQRKRDFRRSTEPLPRPEKKRGGKEPLFVVQKHAARRLHYDFRLEMDGVLKSWAVPKGIPMVRGDKRLAIHVEDHPMDYARFEGTIPEENYGAGTVMVWDIGTYSVHGPEHIKAYKAGKLHLTLRGKKLNGDWTLVRMKPRPGDDKENWLFFKSVEDAKTLSSKKEDESVLTGRSMRQIAEQNDAQWQSNREVKVRKIQRTRAAKDILKPELGKLPEGKVAFVLPMKSKLVEKPPQGDSWIYEIKMDGFRTMALKEGKDVQLFSRTLKRLNESFPEIAKAVGALPFQKGVLDGEIVALDEEGRSSFQLLQMANMPGEQRPPICFYLFDLLNLEGKDLKTLPLGRRKEILQSLIGMEHEPVRFSPSIRGDPNRLLDEIRKHGLEGIIAKRVDSKYEPGLRTGKWAKVKLVSQQEFVIGGYTQPKGSRDYFGALLAGYYENDKLMFASKVGSGFNQALLESLYEGFQKLRRPTCPFVNLPEKRSGRYGQRVTASEMKKCTWLEPKLVCEIRFSEWTRDGHLRQPVFLGLREDVQPQEVRREKPS